MIALKYSCLLIAATIASSNANPLPQKDASKVGEVEYNQKYSNTVAREARQGYNYDYPYENLLEYYKTYYPDYYNAYYDQAYQQYYPQRPSYYGNNISTRKKYNNRRQGLFEPTTQKYTVWDLAKK